MLLHNPACELHNFSDYALLTDRQRVGSIEPLPTSTVVIDDETVPSDQDIWEAFEQDLQDAVDCQRCHDMGCWYCR